MVHINTGSPTLVSVQTEGSEECLEFLSEKHDEMQTFRVYAEQELKRFAVRLTELRVKVEEAGKASESLNYSFQYNIKIVGVPELRSRESAMDTNNLCVKLFSEMGVNITLQDIDITHRMLQKKMPDLTHRRQFYPSL